MRDARKKAEYMRGYSRRNRARLAAYYRERDAKPEIRKRRRELARERYAKNKATEKERKAQAYQKNKSKFLARNKRWKVANRARMRASERVRNKRPHNRASRAKARRERRRRDPAFRIADFLRARIWFLLRNRGLRKSVATERLLGCSFEDFAIYLESKFESGMTWDNYEINGWHVDHIMPCAIFDLAKADHQKRCFHFSNMQPMWASENRSKGATVSSDQFNLI